MDEVRVGIIGVGNMGTAHIQNIKDTPRMKLTALCDLKKEMADKKAADNGAKAYYDSEELIKSGNVDAVIIATPHYDHTPIAISALEHGLHVLTEKPVAVHKKDAQKMIDAHAKRPDLKFAAMFNQRTLEAHKKIKQLIDNGELGKIMRVNWIITNWFRSQSYYNSGGWRATWEGEGGGVLLNQCPHQLDLFQWFFGLPVKVRAFASIGKYHAIEVEDDVTAYCEFENGATGVFISSTGEAPGTNRLEITATKGRLVFEDNKLTFIRNEVPVDEHCATTEEGFAMPEAWDVNIRVKENSGNQHQKIIQNFCDAILDDVPLIARAEEGINSVEFGNAMLYSSMNEQTVEMPLDGDAFEVQLKDLIANSTFVKASIEEKETDLSNTYGN